MKRVKLIEPGGNYFSAPKSNIKFIPSGSKLLDLALGGGWAERRVSNIVGDRSTGKTLICIEACANFAIKYPKGKIRYRECESAFDRPYAKAMGMPIDRVDFGDNQWDTVEDMFEDLDRIAKGAKSDELVIVDSLDALSDRAEMERDLDKGSYGTAKAKNLSEMFRRSVRKWADSKVTLIIVSQVRDNIGAFGYASKTKRSGGRALDFYASQRLDLAQVGTISKTVSNVKRPFGIKIKAKCVKNKVAMPLREAEFRIIFGYGIDDVQACLEWLKESRHLKDYTKRDTKDVLSDLEDMKDAEYQAELAQIHKVVEQTWYIIEREFLPTRKKYP